MKLIVGEKAYVQKFVMAFMEDEFFAIPGLLYTSFIAKYPIHSIRGADDAVRFGFEFDDPDTVEFIKNCPYILDYAELSKKSIKELENLLIRTVDEHNARANDFDVRDAAYKKKHEHEMQNDFDQTRLMCESIKALIACKKGEIKMPTLPDGTEPLPDDENPTLLAKLRGLFSK